MKSDTTPPNANDLDVIIVGAGFAGIYMLYRLRRLGIRAIVYEAGAGVGGTWFWNRYPGARCDVPSLDYSYSFSEDLQQEWSWTERYAAQPEIERYANHVVDRFELRTFIKLNARVVSAEYNDQRSEWTITTENGESTRARFCIMATGGYSVPIRPSIPGIDLFAGDLLYTAEWPHQDVSFGGKRVGVIGTGSSGMQTATAIAESEVCELYVFQRTADYVMRARNFPLDDEYQANYKADYEYHRKSARSSGSGLVVSSVPPRTNKTTELSENEFLSRADQMWDIGGSGATIQAWFPDLIVDERANQRVAGYLRERVRAAVQNGKTAELLCAKRFPVGARRLLVSDGYLSIYNRLNVHLVDVSSAPIEINQAGVVVDATPIELDVIVCATGFDSGTGAMLRVRFRGSEGRTLANEWTTGPRTYLGLGIAGFPNLFTIAQAGSPSIRSQVIVSIEQHVDWIAEFLQYIDEKGIDSVEPTIDAQEAWTHHVADVASKTLLTAGDTQYNGANVPRKPRVYTSYVGGITTYRAICDEVAANDYEGWILRRGAGRIANRARWSGRAVAQSPEDDGSLVEVVPSVI